jgi:hypothetical protein
MAMKYVMCFACLDFFVDDQIVPEEHTSPLLRLIMAEDCAEQEKKSKANRVINNVTNNDADSLLVDVDKSSAVDKSLVKSAFAKLKNYKTTDSLKTPSEPNQTTKVVFKETYNNRFVNMGKTCNWSPLQKPPPRKSPLFDADSTTEFDGIFENAQNQQKQVLDYKSFRLMNLFSSAPKVSK